MNQKISMEQVLKDSFGLWKSGMKYNVLFSLLYFGLLMIFVNTILVYTGILDKMATLYPILLKNPDIFLQRMEALAKTDEFASATLMIVICRGLIYPLHIGLLNIFKKIDHQEETSVGDLFDGYSGMDFFKFASYYIAWFMIYNFAMQLFIVPAFLWVMFTMFVPLLMNFKGEPMGTALIWNFKLIKENFGLLVGIVLAAIVFSYVGFTLFLVGYIVTFPFWCAVLYVSYKNVIGFDKK